MESLIRRKVRGKVCPDWSRGGTKGLREVETKVLVGRLEVCCAGGLVSDAALDVEGRGCLADCESSDGEWDACGCEVGGRGEEEKGEGCEECEGFWFLSSPPVRRLLGGIHSMRCCPPVGYERRKLSGDT